MIKCPECGKDISNQSDKCIYCGFPIRNEDMIVCSNCGVLNQAGSTFCSSAVILWLKVLLLRQRQRHINLLIRKNTQKNDIVKHLFLCPYSSYY